MSMTSVDLQTTSDSQMHFWYRLCQFTDYFRFTDTFWLHMHFGIDSDLQTHIFVTDLVVHLPKCVQCITIPIIGRNLERVSEFKEEGGVSEIKNLISITPGGIRKQGKRLKTWHLEWNKSGAKGGKEKVQLEVQFKLLCEKFHIISCEPICRRPGTGLFE